jgi:hypothetical protein
MFFNEKGEIMDDYNDTSNLFDTDLGEIESEAINERYLEFKVTKPTQVGGVFTYEVSGYTKEGTFAEMKRYSDFDKLRKVLNQRWPGFYIPALPPKQTFVSLTKYKSSVGQYGTRIREGKIASP